MKKLLLTFDVEEFDVPIDYGIHISEEEQCKLSYKGLIRILKLLDKLNIKATFFVTYNFAKQYKNLIKKISLKHEIGLHGYKHSDNYKKMEYYEAYLRLKDAKLGIEKIIGRKITGFRAPKLYRPKYEVLFKLGLKYDSSLNPTYIPGKYNNFFSKRKSFEKNGIKVVPTSVVPLIRFPLFWLSFHIVPLSLIKILTRLSLINMNFLCLYFHPWEFVDINVRPYNENIFKLILKNTGYKLQNKVKNYLKWCLNNGLKDSTISEYLRM